MEESLEKRKVLFKNYIKQGLRKVILLTIIFTFIGIALIIFSSFIKMECYQVLSVDNNIISLDYGSKLGDKKIKTFTTSKFFKYEVGDSVCVKNNKVVYFDKKLIINIGLSLIYFIPLCFGLIITFNLPKKKITYILMFIVYMFMVIRIVNSIILLLLVMVISMITSIKKRNRDLRFKNNMENMLNDLINNDDKNAYKVLLDLEDYTDMKYDLYDYFDKILLMLDNEKTFVRIRGFRLICSLAKWDVDNKINNNIDLILKIFDDNVSTNVRESLNKVNLILLYKPELREIIKNKLSNIDISKYNESMQSLIKKDIIKLNL